MKRLIEKAYNKKEYDFGEYMHPCQLCGKPTDNPEGVCPDCRKDFDIQEEKDENKKENMAKTRRLIKNAGSPAPKEIVYTFLDKLPDVVTAEILVDEYGDNISALTRTQGISPQLTETPKIINLFIKNNGLQVLYDVLGMTEPFDEEKGYIERTIKKFDNYTNKEPVDAIRYEALRAEDIIREREENEE